MGKMPLRAVLTVVTVLVFGMCHNGVDRGTSAAPGAPKSSTPVVDTVVVAVPDSLDRLIGVLRKLPGSFQRIRPGGPHAFTGDREIILAISAFEDSAVVRLVDCLDDLEPATATLNGERVPMGVMCAEALRFTASYEATDEDGDIDATWPGYFNLPASPEELRAAKRAWQEVVREKRYMIP